MAGRHVPQPWPETLRDLVNGRTGVFKIEIVRSLTTQDGRVAEQRTLGHIAHAHALVEQATQRLRASLREMLPRRKSRPSRLSIRSAFSRSMRSCGDRASVFISIRTLFRLTAKGMSEDDLRAYDLLVRCLDQGVRTQTARMRPGDTIGLLVNNAVEGPGLTIPPDSSSWRELELAF